MPTFKLYSCKLRLEGSVLNEVPKDDLTVAEIEMYRAMHGADAVVNIVETGSKTARDADERARVKDLFLSPMDAPPRLRAKTEMFRNLFGHDSLPLPKAIADDDAEEADEEVVDTAPKTPIRRTRAPRVEPEANFAE